jgi:altronate dehydratase small subunit
MNDISPSFATPVSSRGTMRDVERCIVIHEQPSPFNGKAAVADPDPRLLRLDETDTCLIVCAPIPAGTRLRLGSSNLLVSSAIPRGQTIASRTLGCGDEVRRCGTLLGWVTRLVPAGAPLDMVEFAGRSTALQ